MFAVGEAISGPTVVINTKPFVMPENPDFRDLGLVAINLGGLVLDSYAGAREIALVEANDRFDEDLRAKDRVAIPDAWKGNEMPTVNPDDDELKRFLKNSV